MTLCEGKKRQGAWKTDQPWPDLGSERKKEGNPNRKWREGDRSKNAP